MLDGKVYFYVKYQHGDIQQITDAQGKVVAAYSYDAWGNLLSSSGDETVLSMNPPTYRGYNYDAQTGLYYLQSRYYSPEWKRFLNADIYTDTDTILGSNMFMYGNNNPTKFVDAEGTFSKQYHYATTHSSALKYFNWTYSDILGKGSRSVDEIFSSFNVFNYYYQSWHFITNIRKKGLPDSRDIRAQEYMSSAVSALRWAKDANTPDRRTQRLKEAFRRWGMAIHPLQDKISHSADRQRYTLGIYYHYADDTDTETRKYIINGVEQNFTIGEWAQYDTNWSIILLYLHVDSLGLYKYVK